MTAGLNILGPPPLIGYPGGFRTPFAVQAYPHSEVVAYVGPQFSGAPADIENKRVNTLAEALPRVRPNRGDIIGVLPGHSENVPVASVDSMDGLVAGTRIVGLADIRHSSAPTFSWSEVGSRWVIEAENVSIENLRLHVDGANGVTIGIQLTNSANGFTMRGCFWRWAQAAALKATTAMTIGAAMDVEIADNIVKGTATHNVTNGILVSGVATGLRIVRNHMRASATAANGLINVTGAALDILIADNVLANSHTASTSVVTLGAAASSGEIARNMCSTLGGAAASTGIVPGATSLCRLFENYVSNGDRETGILTGTPAT